MSDADASGRDVVLAITGASGAAYAVRLLEGLLRAGARVHAVVSPLGQRLLADELDLRALDPAMIAPGAPGQLRLYAFAARGSRLASGSFVTDGMVVCPCSANTLGAIAAGIADNCITRAAAVHLKQRRPLVLVYREMPVSRIDLENMLRVDGAGGIICPACPGFYHRPRSVGDVVDFVVGKVLDLLQVAHDLVPRWQPLV